MNILLGEIVLESASILPQEGSCLVLSPKMYKVKLRIVLELIRNCEHIHARLKGEQHHLLVAIVLHDRPHLHVVGNHNAVLVQLLAQNASDDRL